MPSYDLTSPKRISSAAKTAHIRAGNEPNQDSYNAAWLYGYATALTDVSAQLERSGYLIDKILDYLSAHTDDAQLYRILHQDLNMSHSEIDSLGFCLDSCHNLEGINMNREFVAVAVGYNFGLIPVEELSNIKLKQVSSIVRLDEQNWNLFKAENYEDSRKVDSLLDRYGEYAIKDHLIEPVIMSGEIEMKLPGFDADRDSFLFGGYSFLCEGKEIPVDFSGVAWDIEQEGDNVLISFITGKTPLLTDYFLDDCYIEEYEKLGLRVNDITAKFLSQASSISEFMVSLEMDGKEYAPEDIAQLGAFKLRSLSFENGNCEYRITGDVLEAFNESLCKNLRPSLSTQIHSAESRSASADSTRRDPDREI